MKNITLIIIGIIIGSTVGVFVEKSIRNNNQSTPEAIQIGKSLGGVEVRDISTENLGIFDIGDGFMLQIQSKKNPKMAIVIQSIADQEMMSGISLLDANGHLVSFTDRDSDGSWDDWSFSSENTSYLYGRMSGFPDTVLDDNKKSLVRINGEYFESELIDGRSYIRNNGKLIEIEAQKWGYFKTKESEQGN
jgi:hypothetical protein